MAQILLDPTIFEVSGHNTLPKNMLSYFSRQKYFSHTRAKLAVQETTEIQLRYLFHQIGFQKGLHTWVRLF